MKRRIGVVGFFFILGLVFPCPFMHLIKWCRKNLVAYKIPQYIEFRDMLPKSKVGKLLRRKIRDGEKRRAEA